MLLKRTSQLITIIFFRVHCILLPVQEYGRMYPVVILREGQNFELCSVTVPLPAGKGPVHLKELHPQFLPLPKYVTQISPGPNYDYHSSVMRFTMSSAVVPDAVVDYDLSNGKWNIIEQQNIFHERRRVLYGTTSIESINEEAINSKPLNLITDSNSDDAQLWNDLSEFYSCEQYNASSYDKSFGSIDCCILPEKQERGSESWIASCPWSSELKSLYRAWIIAYADVRGGGGGGKKWHHDGEDVHRRLTPSKTTSPVPNFLLTERLSLKTNLLVGVIVLEDSWLLQPSINPHIYFRLQF